MSPIFIINLDKQIKELSSLAHRSVSVLTPLCTR